jgi:PAS domain-containing protein
MALAVGIVIYAGQAAWHLKQVADVQRHRLFVVNELLASDETAIVILTPDDRICEWSPGAEKLFGWTTKEVIGSPPNFLMSAGSWAAHQRAFAESAKLSADHSVIAAHDCWAFTKDKGPLAVHFVVAPFKDHVGYYHMAIMSKETDFKKIVIATKPDPGEVPPVPAPAPLPPEPGIYHAFQND